MAKNPKTKNQIKRRALLGACIGALTGVGGPFLWLFLDSAFYAGGGANIGLGLLIMAMPFYAPVLILFGALYGAATSQTVISAIAKARQNAIRESAEPEHVVYICSSCRAMSARATKKCDRCGALLLE